MLHKSQYFFTYFSIGMVSVLGLTYFSILIYIHYLLTILLAKNTYKRDFQTSGAESKNICKNSETIRQCEGFKTFIINSGILFLIHKSKNLFTLEDHPEKITHHYCFI